MAKVKQVVPASKLAPIPPTDLVDFVRRNMRVYGMETNLERALVDFRDGLKPVSRRLLWSMRGIAYDQKSKAARMVGDVLGRFHPHGDCLRAGTLVPLMSGKNVPIEQLVGKGSLWVWAYDEETDRIVPARAHSWRVGHTTRTAYRIVFNTGDQIECTKNHPFYQKGKGWRRADELKVGMQLVGGNFSHDAYMRVTCNNGFSGLAHRIVAEATFDADELAEDGNVVHHVNEKTRDNRPHNLELLSRREHHLEHLDNAVSGLDKGRERQFSGKDKRLRSAIRNKNSALLSEYNKWSAVIKSVKAVMAMLEQGLRVTPANYAKMRSVFYNLSSLAKIEERYGLTLHDLKDYARAGGFKIDTTAATGLTQHLKKPKAPRGPRTPQHRFGPHINSLSKIGSVLRRMVVKGNALDDISWEDYVRKARKLAGHDNLSKVLYCNAERLRDVMEVDTVKELAGKLPASSSLFITRIDIVELPEKEDFYDFTVDGYENMCVLLNERRGSFVVAHNTSAFGALVTLANDATNTVDGEGNWGTLLDPPAAMRYVECKMSKYGKTMFARFYIDKEITPFVPNYDRRDVEPLFLPALLPNVLFNGTTGIGVGVAASIPSFTPPSVLKVMADLLKGEKLTSDDYVKRLEFYEPWGATAVKDKVNRARIKALMESTSGSVEFESPIEEDRDRKIIRLRWFTPGVNIEKLIERINGMQEVQSCDQGKGVLFEVQIKKTVNFNEYDRVCSRIKKMLVARQSYGINVTERVADPHDPEAYEVHAYSLTIPQLMVKWLKWRIELEARSLDYRILLQEAAIARTELLIWAVDNVDAIIKIIRTADDPKAALMAKKWANGKRLQEWEAEAILELKLRQLSKLDERDLKGTLKNQKAELAELKHKRTKPKQEVINYLETAAKAFKLVPNEMGFLQWRM